MQKKKYRVRQKDLPMVKRYPVTSFFKLDTKFCWVLAPHILFYTAKSLTLTDISCVVTVCARKCDEIAKRRTPLRSHGGTGRSSSWRQLPTANATKTSWLMWETFLKLLSTICAVRDQLAWWRMLPSDQTKPSPPRYSLSRMWRLITLDIVKMLEENVSQLLKMPMKTKILTNVIAQDSAPAPTTANTQTWCVAPKRMVHRASKLLHYRRKWGHLRNLSWTQWTFPPDQSSRVRSPEASTPVSPFSNATSKLHGGTWTRTPCGARAPQRRGVSRPREGRGGHIKPETRNYAQKVFSNIICERHLQIPNRFLIKWHFRWVNLYAAPCTAKHHFRRPAGAPAVSGQWAVRVVFPTV